MAELDFIWHLPEFKTLIIFSSLRCFQLLSVCLQDMPFTLWSLGIAPLLVGSSFCLLRRAGCVYHKLRIFLLKDVFLRCSYPFHFDPLALTLYIKPIHVLLYSCILVLCILSFPLPDDAFCVTEMLHWTFGCWGIIGFLPSWGRCSGICL